MKNLSLLPLSLILTLGCSDENVTPRLPANLPDVSTAVFSNPTNITNLYYGPGVGEVYIYEGSEVGEEAEEEIRIERFTDTKLVMGVTCVIHKDLVFLEDILIEDTEDWLAQDDAGNLWYFGEFVKNYTDEGDFDNNEGSWEAGVDKALPGYWMIANPVIGDDYMQEYLKGEAEDYAEIVGFETVVIGMGTFTDCLVTRDINPFEEDVEELKYYAPGIGFIKEALFEDGELVETLELIEIQ